MNEAIERDAGSADFDVRAENEHPLAGTRELCLHEVFESQAASTPDAVALTCDGRELTYSELDRRSNRLARLLRERGARPGSFVAVHFDRSELPVIAILACHKSGAAYVPIDPAYPEGRIRHIAGELDILLCLTDSARSSAAREFFTDDRVLVLDDEWTDVEDRSDAPLTREDSGVSPGDLAYVIYTSGTTGRPKGVMTEHRNVTRFVAAFNETCATGPGDRVYQGFSLSFDGSVEEIWMAFSNGSTLVVPSPDAPRFGSELAAYLAETGVTYFSTVPTLLATLPTTVDSLRTVVLSGEVCAPELVSRWARPGLRILNVYGPTEATVNTTVAECVAGKPVTIGRPLRGYGVHIVDEQLRPVPRGVAGELLISGETLACGYLKQPELTDERFLHCAQPSGQGTMRCYRTGDLARWNDDGEIEFLGRMDGQVKIRGFRVELAEIESVLLEDPQIQSASVALVERDGLQDLAAYVTTSTDAEKLDRDEVLVLLESRLLPYMIPGYLDVVTELPRTPSGKVDRKLLPTPVRPLVRSSTSTVAPESELEHVIADTWATVLGVPVASVESDFFLDLGGHSLVAARMVTLLREKTLRPVTVRDAYRLPTIRALATHLESVPVETAMPPDPDEQKAGATSARAVFDSTSRWERCTTWLLQVVSIYVLSGLVSIPLVVVFLSVLDWLYGSISFLGLVGVVALVSVVAWPVYLLLSIAAKWVLIGRYKPGEHKLWSFYYCRWWIANRLMALSGAGALAGTPLMPVYYRLLGARVGPRCTLDTAQCSAWDLVSIGSDTSIGAETQLLGYRVENGMLRLGRVEVGSRCFVGIHSALGLDVRMEDDSCLDDQSLLPDRDVIPAGQGRQGSPAVPSEVALPGGSAPQTLRRRMAFGLAHLVTGTAMGIVVISVPTVLFGLLIWLLVTRFGWTWGISVTVLSVPLDVIVFCCYLAGVKRLVLHRIPAGTYPVLSATYLRKWLSDQLMTMTRPLLLPVYTTLYLPPVLRLMGAKIGRRAEISTVWRFAPELIDVDAESFFADGSIIGGRRCHRGLCTIAVNRIGRRSFVGNSAVLPVGASLGDRCLLGAQSLAPTDSPRTPDGTEWLGAPAFALTHRPKVGNFDDTVTFAPTVQLYLKRGVIDALRILIPYYLLMVAAAFFFVALFFAYQSSGLAVMLALAPVLGFVSGVWAALVVAGLKKVVMGTYTPQIKPLWSKYVWLNEMVNGAYESVVAPLVSLLLGTPFAAPFLRMMGCRIGRRGYIGTTLFSEFDLVDVGDYVALNHGVVVQNHLFEDRVFKSSTLKIRDEASVGNMSVVLYDSEIERGAVVGPLSLLMKGETLRPGTRWHGIPTLQVTAPVRTGLVDP
ncbi:Pls/PosA family non-ribosomal peptide synthetase [Allokutzneria oryzae]|uniref:Pls/PosA family non-ribosomal peptide synthetase n=1 Tax=Allokutzneria oryzae TaxID=1378989 RepID=A0ABV6A3B7_9PSEU